MFIDALEQREAEVIFDHLHNASAMMSVTQIRVLGGAMARVPADATAFAHRDRRIMAHVAALYMNPEDAPQQEAWADAFAAALRQTVPARTSTS